MVKRPLSIHVVSLGCPKNRVDTEFLLGALGPVRLVDSPDEADAVLVNTCAFIQPAVEESLAVIMDLARDMARLDPRPPLIVAGCLVDRYRQELQADLPEADILLPIAHYSAWPECLSKALSKKLSPPQGRRMEPESGSAYLKIAEGCNNTCAFCTIPSIRGPLQSRTRESLIQEAALLAKNGIKELVLVAQDVTAYGRDHHEPFALPRLLEELLEISALKWIRLMYLYPSGLDEDFLKFLSGCGPALLPYFDVPFQHSHADILRSMGRPFQTDPRRIVDRIRTYFPHAALRTTLITGFPGEKPKHFRHLLDFVAQTRFHHLGAFPFWPEQGTRAAQYEDQISQKTRKKRQEEIMALQAEISADILNAMVGRQFDVLVERPHGEWPGLYLGRTWFQAPEVDGMVYISGPKAAPGQMVKVEVEEALEYDLVTLTDANPDSDTEDPA